MARIEEKLCHSIEETMLVAREFGKTLSAKSIVCLFGELGAGKTSFVKGLAMGAIGVNSAIVNSPTYVYLNIYSGEFPLYHFDLYRLKDEDEFLSMGFDEMLFDEGICCIEWSERIKALIPPSAIKVTLQHISENSRLIRIER